MKTLQVSLCALLICLSSTLAAVSYVDSEAAAYQIIQVDTGLCKYFGKRSVYEAFAINVSYISQTRENYY